MKKNILKLLLFITVLFMPFVINAKEKEINVYLFYGNGCPHCADAKVFFEEYSKENKNFTLYQYEIWNNKKNVTKYKDAQEILNITVSGVPFLIIGEKYFVGFSKTHTKPITEAIEYYQQNDYNDPVGEYLGFEIIKPIIEKPDIKPEEKPEPKVEENNEFNVPILGKVEAKNVSLTSLAIVIGLVDGFNPCAMWILILLISLLFGMKNKKKMWILGMTFLVVSGLVYMFFMLSWLNLALFLNSVYIIRLLIALAAITFGLINLKKYFAHKEDGCEVVNSTRRKKLITRVKHVIESKSFIAALAGIIVLAVSVNVLELMCSLGLPVVFTQILTLNDLSSSKYFIYVLIYTLFFMIDDIILFILAMKTLEIKAISNKYTKYSHLIGGIIMVLLGLLMVFKPEWLMLNF